MYECSMVLLRVHWGPKKLRNFGGECVSGFVQLEEL